MDSTKLLHLTLGGCDPDLVFWGLYLILPTYLPTYLPTGDWRGLWYMSIEVLPTSSIELEGEGASQGERKESVSILPTLSTLNQKTKEEGIMCKKQAHHPLRVAIPKCWKLKAVPLICSYAACRGRYSFALPDTQIKSFGNWETLQ